MADTVVCQYATMKEEMVWSGDAPYTPIEQSAAPASHGGSGSSSGGIRGGQALPIRMSMEEDNDTTTPTTSSTTEQQGLNHVPRTESETDLV
jgi:hypothetical protein